ncbi:glutathione S-transferase family protein [Variovorax sp. J22P168]|uniref:glutathione S-transferase family protein n=1 Tax=Variovorax jilinensis TaxID=3053513 RepID=UPI00257578EC|nr:glutathione S-transferase family protein [Variovorax sp. J22P168]MDM0015454.1 glutathione S-transferase family protein [Variovorax sp. J22P168]
MITLTAMKWAPPFAAGQVRDHRVRWILNEVDWSYRVRLVDAPTMKSAGYRHSLQPFGQLPVLEEEGRPPMFESGAIVLDVAMRAGRCIGGEGTPERAAAIQWVIAGLNSIEPFLFNVAEVEYFMDDDAVKDARKPVVRALAKERLAALEKARDGRDWWVGNTFTVADLMFASILKVARGLDLLGDLPALAAWQQEILARPAHVKAETDQRAEIARHSPADMRYDQVPKPPA